MIPLMLQTIGEYVKSIISENNLDCYVLFNSDCHLNEYIGPKDRRVPLISNFKGSNATVVISKEPCLITDSRYYIQAESESKFPLYKEDLFSYIALKGYKRVSFDTRTISSTRFKKLLEKFEEKSIKFIFTDFQYQIKVEEKESKIIYLENYNLGDFLGFPKLHHTVKTNYSAIDKLVQSSLTETDFAIKKTKEDLNIESLNIEDSTIVHNGVHANPLIIGYLKFLGFENFNGNVTGTFYQDKIKILRSLIDDKTLIVTELDTICWILNLRGNDIEFNPLFYSYLIIDQISVTLFTDKVVKLDDITVKKYNEFEKQLTKLVNEEVIISGDCNQFIYSQFHNIEKTDKIRSLQASKNEIELCGMALAYFFDGLALTELFSFIENNKNFTEKDLSNKLDEIKRNFPGYVQPSFETISSTGTNAAIVHHEAGSTVVDKNNVYLIDSGSQYYFGTTDTTRTLFFGKEVPKDLKHDFTLVLRGQLNAMMKNYEKGSKYLEIDEISRSFLKKENKDFGHATGHGVGHFLCVHEHPPVVYPGAKEEIVENQVFSIEPGYYKEDEYGIRIENLVISRKSENGFKIQNITLVPYQNAMVEIEMLTENERKFYNGINLNCLSFLQQFLSFEAYEFLRKYSNLI